MAEGDGVAGPAGARPPRLLCSETLDPDGAMFRWLSADLEALGWDVLRVPTQQAVHRLGPSAYQAWLVELAEGFRPDVVLAHPPYDFLCADVAARLRATGAKVVAYAFDDAIALPPLAAAGRLPAVARDLERTWDLYATTDRGCAALLTSHGLRRVAAIRWAASAAPFADHAPLGASTGALAHSAVLVGRPYARRVALLQALGGAPLRVQVHGHGWAAVAGALPANVRAGGPLTREAMNAVHAAAGVVITTGDWEAQALPMVKVRLLEVALAGGFQVAQAAPDLRDYFPEEAVPAWRDAAELAALCERFLADPAGRARAAALAQAIALREHGWATRWPEVVGALGGVAAGVGASGRPDGVATPAGWVVVMEALALAEEQAGRWRAARELHGAVVARRPELGAAWLGLGRARYRLGDAAAAAEAFSRALERLPSEGSEALRGLPWRWPTEGVPPGLGLAGHLDPSLEAEAFLLASLADAGREEEALARLGDLTEDHRVAAVAGLLEVPEAPREPRFWAELGRRAALARRGQAASTS